MTEKEFLNAASNGQEDVLHTFPGLGVEVKENEQ